MNKETRSREIPTQDNIQDSQGAWQEKTWRKAMRDGGKATSTLQPECHYIPSVNEGREVHPHSYRIHPDLQFWHPKPSTLNLTWTHTGQWVKVPRKQDQPGGPDYHSYKVARLEKYVDIRGDTKTAVAYGDEDDKLLVWYHVSEMHERMSWIIPAESPWVNTRKWRNELKTIPQSQKNKRGGGVARGGAPRRRGLAPRGRGYENRGSQDSWRENYRGGKSNYPENRYPEHGPDRGQYRGHEWKPRISGAGRSSGPASHPRKDRKRRPGYNSRREDSRSRREDRNRQDSYRQDGYRTERSSSREGRRNHGAERTRRHGYGRGTRRYRQEVSDLGDPPAGDPSVSKPGYNPNLDSPRAGLWPDPTKEAFKRPQRIRRNQVFSERAKKHRIYFYEEGSFYFSQNSTLALSNRYECLSYNDYVNNNNKFDFNKNNDDDGNNYDEDGNQSMNDGNVNLFLNDTPIVDYDFEYAEYIYKKNKNLCSGYFCSLVPLINNNNILNIPIYKKGYKKQISNEFSKYNKNYINKINSRCSEIVDKHFNKPRVPKTFKGSESKTQPTQGHNHLIDKVYINKTVGSGPYKYNTLGSNSSKQYNNMISGHNRSRPGQHRYQEDRSSKPKRITLQNEQSSGPTVYTTPGCIGSGPSTYPIAGTGAKDTSQTSMPGSQVKEKAKKGSGPRTYPVPGKGKQSGREYGWEKP